MDEIKLFPVQTPGRSVYSEHSTAKVRESVYMAAYEVYSHVYSPQKELITNGCRGGFSTGELIAFLYARSFPKEQWSARADEAFRGMEHL
jgi:surfactin synthase thioesterase subunit